MGGRSFLERMEGAAFPRMNSATYHARRALHAAHLGQMFHVVTVPREAPEKGDYGDLDFLVCDPIQADACTPEALQALTRAVQCIQNGPVFHLAIPGGGEEGLFYQVDITQCHDKEELDRFAYFQGYGDLGMILGLLARANGLSLGLHGLKIPQVDPMPAPFPLSTDFPHIFEFYGLDIGAWEAGFSTIVGVFEWVATSRLYDPRHLQESQHRAHRRRDRTMFQRFLAWTDEQAEVTLDEQANMVEAAKAFFGKGKEYEMMMEGERRRRRQKENFNGHLVMAWTGLQGKDVKVVMDEVRKNVDDGQLETMSREDVRNWVLEACETVGQRVSAGEEASIGASSGNDCR